MIFKNTTRFSDESLKKMIRWCCDQVGFPYACLKRVQVRNRSDEWISGRAWLRDNRICLSLGYNKPSMYPYYMGHRRVKYTFPTYESIIVFVTAHELQHLQNMRLGIHEKLTKDRDMEPHCDRVGKRIMQVFNADREALLNDWGLQSLRPELALAVDLKG